MASQGLYYTDRLNLFHLFATLLLVLLGFYVANYRKRVSGVKPIPRVGIATGRFGFGLGRAKKDFAHNGYDIIQRGYEMVMCKFTCKQRQLSGHTTNH